ncbi:hypothetical protein EVAR_91726_1 [Eumeta japonica]|uniref:Uncharacterized protein n=1 Tax=Eumeta variegata TaxID=151549 RepID=A0A4C1TE78_EUMVA|nr:hypothetical protein EVAR_91726_1 [Eumeta japonica]
MHIIDGYLLSNPPQQLQVNRDPRYTPSPIYSLSSNNSVTRDLPSNSSSNSYTSQPLRSPQISISERPPSHKSYLPQPQQSPILLSIADHTAPAHNPTYLYVISSSPAATASHPAITATFNPVPPTQNRVTILSQEIITPSNSQTL